jgi:hypothetical protein
MSVILRHALAKPNGQYATDAKISLRLVEMHQSCRFQSNSVILAQVLSKVDRKTLIPWPIVSRPVLSAKALLAAEQSTLQA